MENTCVIHFLPVIPNWKVYNLPQKKPVEYFSILKQKREFQSLVKKAVVDKYLKTGSCSIVSKEFHFSGNAKNIEIIFLSEIHLLSLTLTIQEKHALKRRTNILVFLKNISNDITYEIKNDYIYTKCEENIKWKIFYSLFEFLLLRYGKSIIGAIFYNYIVLGHMLMNERTFLYQLTVEYGSPLQSMSEHNKQNSCVYSAKETLRSVDKNQKGITFNSLQFNKNSCVPLSSQDIVSIISNLSVKRKATEDISFSCKLAKQNFSDRKICPCLKMNCKCHKSKWKVLRNIQPYNVDSYMDILLRKGVLSDNEFSDSFKSNSSFQEEPLPVKNISLPSNHTDRDDKCDEISGKQVLEDSVELSGSNVFQNEEQSSLSKNDKNDIFLKEKTQDVNINGMDKEQINSLQVNSLKKTGFREDIKKENISTLFSEFIDKDECEDDGPFCMFKTAAGKKVIVSQTALKSAEQMFADVLNCEEPTDCEIKTLNKSAVKSDFKNRMKTPVYKPPHFPRKSNIENDADETIDGVLAEKMFEEISFEERDIENCSEVLCVPSLPSAFASNVNERMVTCGKVRKSLGGRRSLKPYAVPNT